MHPLVEEANVITREVFGNSDLHLEQLGGSTGRFCENKSGLKAENQRYNSVGKQLHGETGATNVCKTSFLFKIVIFKHPM